jgi:hypothetical protein
MGRLPRLRLRPAGSGDAAAIGSLHADSWRRHYRGAYSERYLDGRLEDERMSLWARRLADPGDAVTLVAEHDGALVGFVHVRPGADREWGAPGGSLVTGRTGRRGARPPRAP